MPASPPQIHRVYLYEPDGGGASFEEAIRCLNQSQPEKLGFRFEREVDGYDEAYKEHRHQFIDAVSTCQSLKQLSINAYDQKLSIEEVKLLCQNLLPALNSLTLDGLLDNDGVQIVCEKMENNCFLKNLSLGLSVEGRMSSAGASLGSMLAINSTLDSLNLNSTDLGPNGVEALLQPLTGHATARPRNKSLTHLTIGGSCFKMRQGAVEAIAHMLETNDTLTHFHFPGDNGLEPSDVCKILESLQKNQTLLSLSLWGCQGVKGPDVSAKMRDLFRMTRSLTDIDLAHTSLEQPDVCKILESLQKNQTLLSLTLWGCQGVNGPDVSAKMMDLFQMNRSLTNINLAHTPLEQSDVCKILESLQKNQTLRYLGLQGCKGVEGPDVLAKMMDLVRMHPSLMKIALAGTPLEREGQAEQVQAQLENIAKDDMAVLRGKDKVPPKFVRVFLRGNAYSAMATSFEDLRRTVQSVVHKLASSENKESQFNALQCEFLEQKASQIVPILDHFEYTLRKHDLHSFQMSWDPPNWIPAAMELQRVLKDAEVLIQECNCDGDQWLQVEIKRGNLKETFARIIYDLEWHTLLLCGLFVPESSAFHSNWETCDGNLRLNDSFIMSAAAEWDRKTLRDSLSSSHICDGEICRADLGEKCLAKQVLDKLDAEEQVSRDPNNFRDWMHLFLWVKPEHLPKGKGRKLGEGSFAKVREIEWLGQKFAQKIFRDGGHNRSFKKEIAAMAGLDHPNIIHAVCCSEDNRRLSIVMELMYKSLNDLLHQDCSSPLSIFQAIDLMLQISEGLRYLHGKNIAHRDLKSLNILVQFANPQPDIRSDGMANITTNTLFVAKVADFGLAKVKNDSTMLRNQTTDLGTTRWMAPEAPSGDAMGSPSDRFHPMKLDVYSFGIICYEILSREEPFDGVPRTQLRGYVQAGNRPQLPDEIPRRLDILIKDCWDGNPLHRPDFAAICTELRFIKLGLLSGCASLGSMLAINSTQDSLNLNSTDLGPNGVEALLQHLTGHTTARPRNKSSTYFTIGGSCFKMLQGAGEAIAHMLRTNDTLTHFRFPGDNGLEPSDVCKILESLQNNQTLLSLSLWGCQGVKGPDVLAKILDLIQMNRSLTNIDLAHTPLEQPDVCKILESLQKNQTLRYLGLSRCKGVKGPDVLAKILDLFQMNRSLTNIDLAHTPFEQPDVCKILESLQKNQTLRYLGLSRCKGVKGPEVLAKMMDLVRIHPSLMEIRLDGTPLQREGQAAQVQAQLENDAKDYMAVLRGMPRVPPKFVRVFLCGNAYSGKTTLGRSMKRAFASGCGPNLFLPLMEVVEVHKPFKFCSNDPDEWSKRTRGIEINVLLDHPNQKISLWDLAGQEEYHAFHDMMMPNLSSQGNVSFFILVCNPFDRESGARKSPETIKEELRSWLRFISSNTKRSFNFPPHITIVITNADKGLFLHKELVESALKELANQFRNYINLSSKLYSINAHSSRDAKDVVEDVTTTCENVLGSLPYVFGACVNVQHGLSDWIKEHPYQPIVAMETFKNDIVAKKVPNLQSMSPTNTHDKNLNPHEAVALFLHDAGEIIYFKDQDFMVVNPHWFCHQVMGHLIKLGRHAEKSQLTTTFHGGLITMHQLEFLLKFSLKNAIHWVGMNEVNIFQHLIQLMIKMDLAYKYNMADHQGDYLANLHPNDTLFVPIALKFEPLVAKGKRRLQWSVKFHVQAIDIYIGRRLQCQDEDVTTFTPGFFPRVQVVLNRYFADLKMGAIFENEKNLMNICVNGLEIFVELSGNEMHGHAFIDILVKSSKSEIQTIQFVHDHVLSRIEHLCTSPEGCQGVTLMRGVLRPEAVKKLLLCKNRTKQVAFVEDLKMELLATNLDLELVHPWPQVDVQGNDFLDKSRGDKVATLLGEVATHDVLERHLQGLKDTEININKLPSAEQESEHTQGETSKRGDLRLQRFFHQRSLQKPTNSEQLIRDIMRAELQSSEEQIVARISTKLEEVFQKTKQEIKCMEQRLYQKLSKKLDGMTKLLLQLHQQQVPCNAFFTTGGTRQQLRLVDNLMGIEVVYLHFLCENIDGIHVVADQKGDEIRYVEDENRHKIAHLVIVGFKIVSILLKVTAHVVGGVGNLVPKQGLALAYDAQNITDCIVDPRIHGRPILGQSGTSHLPTAKNALVEDHKVATQWLVDFLRGKNIFKLFGLNRVRYLKIDRSHGDFSTIRWVCLHHRKEGLENGTLEDCP